MFSYSYVITHDSENKPFEQQNKHLGLVYPTVTRANKTYPENTTKQNYARFTPPN